MANELSGKRAGQVASDFFFIRLKVFLGSAVVRLPTVFQMMFFDFAVRSSIFKNNTTARHRLLRISEEEGV